MADSVKPKTTTPKPKPASKTATGTKKPAAKKPAPKKPVKPTPTWSEQNINDAYDSKATTERLASSAGLEKGSRLYNWSLKHSNRFFKLLLGLSAVLPLAPSIALLVFIVTNRSWGGWLVWWVENDRGDVQVIVSMIVSTLTYFNVLIISKLLWDLVGFKPGNNFVFKFLLSNIKMDSDADKAASNLGNTSWTKWWELFTVNLNARDFFKGLACFALLYAPHIIWTGVLTPNIVSEGTYTTKDYLIPDYTPANQETWSNNGKGAGGLLSSECDYYSGDAKDYNPCIATQVQSFVWSNMMSANRFPFGFLHAKPDNTTYSYEGRSYGVGSGAGIQDVTVDIDLGVPVGRNYTELGYWTDVNCTRNSSSDFQLTRQESAASSSFASFTVGGRLPNSAQTLSSYSIVAAANNLDAVAWATDSSNNEFMLGIGTFGDYYKNLSNIQCRIQFTSTNFYVFDNYTDGTLVVERGDPQPQPQFDADGGLANTAISQLGLISQLQISPSSSDLGDALMYNMGIYEMVDGELMYNDNLNDTEQLSSVAQAIAVALDDILEYVAASQLALGASKEIDYIPLVQRVVIGTKKYIAVAMAMTGLLFLAAVGRAIWRAIPGDEHGPRPHLEKDEKKDGKNLLHGEPEMV